jgi:hypothetical protein
MQTTTTEYVVERCRITAGTDIWRCYGGFPVAEPVASFGDYLAAREYVERQIDPLHTYSIAARDA